MTTRTELTVHSSADFEVANADSLDILSQSKQTAGGSFFGPGSSMIRHLAQINGREIGPDQEGDLGYCAGQLTLLAQKIAEGDCHSDLSGYAALPRVLYELCGSENSQQSMCQEEEEWNCR